MRRIAFINSDWHNEYRRKYNKIGGVGYYRLFLPKIGLEKITDWKIDLIGSDFESLIDTTTEDTTLQSYVNFFKKYDLVVLKHFDNPNAGRFMFAASDITGVPIVTDLDDDIFSVREDQPAHKLGYRKGEAQRITIATMLSFSKALFVTNEILGKNATDYIKKSTGVLIPYYVLPNQNNIAEWAKYKAKKPTNKVVIGWHGSITHNADLSMVLPVIKEILKDYPNVYLELMGGITREYALEIFKDWELELLNRIDVRGGTQAWDKFPYTLMKQKWSIGIAPLIDDTFNQSKSNIKWLEYTMKHIPTVASNVEPYRSIKHGVTGILCDTPEQWYVALKELIEDSKLRDRLAENSYKEIKKNWQYDKNAKLWKKAIDSVLKAK
jgi:glycosyltransferase involved in cell wall biosynthesis